MKKFLSVLLIAGLMLSAAAPAFAQSRYGLFTTQPIESTGIATGQDGNTMDYEVWIYGLSIYADAASSFMGIYDCDTMAELNSGTTYARDEIGEPTQYEYTDKMYDEPRRFTDGVGVIIFTGVGFVHYGPAP